VLFVNTLPANMTYLGNPKIALVSTIAGNSYTVAYATTASNTFTLNADQTLSNAPPSKIDNVNPADGSIILVKNQGNGAQNGLYTSTGNGALLTRLASYAPLSGDVFTVTSGATNAGTTWKLTTPDPITIG